MSENVLGDLTYKTMKVGCTHPIITHILAMKTYFRLKKQSL